MHRMISHIKRILARSEKHMYTSLLVSRPPLVEQVCVRQAHSLLRERHLVQARQRHTRAVVSALLGEVNVTDGPRRKSKRRLDEACMQQTPDVAGKVIQSWIVQGKVLVDGKVINKPGSPVSAQAAICINAAVDKYVCRAGHKMEAALDHFQLDVAGLTCLDAGLSTGGFTDCLLQRGATKVYGVDVGFGQVAERLRQDPRLIVVDRTNLRYLKLQDLPDVASPVDLVTLDLSFISVLKVMPAVCDVLRPGGKLIVLIKPQFEASRDQVASGGVVRDEQVHQEVIAAVSQGVVNHGFSAHGHMLSPITGATSGNKEFLAYFTRNS